MPVKIVRRPYRQRPRRNRWVPLRASNPPPADVAVANDLVLRADIYDSAGAKLSVQPLTTILQATYGVALNRLGSFSVTIPADDAAAAGVTIGRQVWVYAPPEGAVFKGVIERTRMETHGDMTVLVIDGASAGKTLTWKTTLLGRTFDNATLASVVSTLLTGTSFTSGSIASPSTNITVRFDGRSIWDAILSVADVFGLLVREDHLPSTPEVDVNSFGTSSGLLFTNPPEITPAMMAAGNIYPITSLRIVTEARDVWNKIIPLGQQSGIAGSDTWFDLADSDRSSPYTIQSAVGPDGKTYYYISDSTSVTAYGTRERVLQVRDILPLGITATDFTRAANTLYDEAVTYLQRHKDEQVAYEVDVVGLKHVSGGAYVFQVGDKVRLKYDGVVQDADGRRAFKSVDNSDLYIMAATRTFDATGASTWKLTVSTVARELPNDGNITERFMSDLQAVKAAPLPYVLFGDNVGRISEGGLELVAASQPTVTGETERKVAWTSSDFGTRYAEVFGSYYSAFATKYLVSRVHDGTDAYHVSGIIKASLTEYDTVQWLSKTAGGDIYMWHVNKGTAPMIGLQYIDDDNAKLFIAKNGVMVEVGGMSLIVKEADETVNNSAALQNDDELLFAVAANEVWQFEGVLRIDANTTEDFQLTFTGPTGAVGSFSAILTSDAASETAGGDALGTTVTLQPGAHAGVLRFWGGIHNGANAGNLTLQWAQRVATAVNTKVLAGSYIKYMLES